MTQPARERAHSRSARSHSPPSLRALQQAGLTSVERLARHQYALAGQSLEWTLAQLRLAGAWAPWSGIAAGIELVRALGEPLLYPTAAASGRPTGLAARAAVDRAQATALAPRARAGTAIRAAQPRTAARTPRRTRH